MRKELLQYLIFQQGHAKYLIASEPTIWLVEEKVQSSVVVVPATAEFHLTRICFRKHSWAVSRITLCLLLTEFTFLLAPLSLDEGIGNLLDFSATANTMLYFGYQNANINWTEKKTRKKWEKSENCRRILNSERAREWDQDGWSFFSD